MLAACGCGALPDIPSDTCGNHVIEPGEDCDGFERESLRCIEPGQNGQCHMDCSPSADGTRSACPAGYGCDARSVCRKATGKFVALPARIIGKAWSLARGDFDGDGSDDVLSQEEPGTLGLSKVRVHHFDRNAVPAQSWSSSRVLSAPTPFALPHDVHAHVAYLSDTGFALLSGESDGSLIPQALPSYVLANASVRVMAVAEQAVNDSAPLIVLADLPAGRGIYHEGGMKLQLAVALSHGVDELAAEPVVADLFEDDACRDLVLAFRDARELTVYSMCESTGSLGQAEWRAKPGVITLQLEHQARITEGLFAADFDGDGHLDLMVGSDGDSYVAYGDGTSFSALRRYPLLGSGSGDQLPMPIAAGDFSGDGIADLVMPHSVFVADASTGARTLSYVEVTRSAGSAWTKALIADFNRDDNPDIVAVSAQGVDIAFYNGTRSASLNPFTIATDRPVDGVAVGDLDGDLINDLAFLQRGVGGDTRDEVSVAFGNLAGAPGPAQRVARLGHVQQMAASRTSQQTAITNLALVFDQDTGNAQGSALALLAGSSDRTLPSVVELSTFTQDNSLQTELPVALALGSFRDAGTTDLITLALIVSDQTLVNPKYQLWLVPSLDAPNGQTLPLDSNFADDLQPLVDIQNPQSKLKVAATMAAGDLDGDGIDELLLAAPDAALEHCLLSVAHVDLDQQRVHADAPIVLPEPCETDTQLTVVDLDGDGARDAVMLYGKRDQERDLLALWGDGSGELHANTLTQLGPRDAQPRAFTLLRRSGSPLEIAYVDAHEARLLRSRSDARRFEDAGKLGVLDDGTAIVAADVDGDGITDLCVADDGAVRVLRAELKPQ